MNDAHKMGAVVIDGPNFSAMLRSLNASRTRPDDVCADVADVIQERMGVPFEFSDRVLVSPKPQRGFPAYEGLLRFHAGLRSQGWRVLWTPPKRDDDAVREVMTDFAVWSNIIVLGSGDGDFAEHARALREQHGVLIVVASTTRGGKNRFGSSPELRWSADVFIEVDELPSLRYRRFEMAMERLVA